MKNIYKLILIFIFTSSFLFPQSHIQNIISEVNIDSLMHFVKELSGNIPTTINGQNYTIASRHKNQQGNDMSMNYIKQKLDSYGLQTTIQTFSTTGKNIYGVKTGNVYPNKKYIICAHFDAMPSGTFAPGADDNASGTAAVIEAARILRNYNFDYTIIFALWDEEEQGLIGSNYFATQARNINDSIMGVINLDMIAFDSNNDHKSEIHTRSVGSSLELWQKMLDLNTNLSIGLTLATKNPGSTYSDHASFWSKSYGAVLLIEDNNDFHTQYHTVNDVISYFNIPYYHKNSKIAIATIADISKIIGVVPVELINFEAEIFANNIILKWSTASETNNFGFEIQRSVAGSQFTIGSNEWETVGFVEGAGTATEINNYYFYDKPELKEKYLYRIKQIDFDGSFYFSDLIEVDFSTPQNFSLTQNYPNPFNPFTEIRYQIAEDRKVSLKVFDILGNEVVTLVNEFKSAGSYNIKFSGEGLTSGVYFYTLQAGEFVETKKMMLMK